MLSHPLTSTEQRLKERMDRAGREAGLAHAALARHLGVKAPSVTRVLTRRSGLIPASLVAVPDVLGLEVNPTPKAPTL